MGEAKRVPLPGGAGAAAPGQASTTGIQNTSNPAFQKLFDKVYEEFKAAEDKLPLLPDGTPSGLGLPDEYIDKVVRKLYDTDLGKKFMDEMVAQVVKAIRAKHGPAQTGSGKADRPGEQRPGQGQVSTRPDTLARERRSIPRAPEEEQRAQQEEIARRHKQMNERQGAAEGRKLPASPAL